LEGGVVGILLIGEVLALELGYRVGKEDPPGAVGRGARSGCEQSETDDRNDDPGDETAQLAPPWCPIS
jgi:hypothetical protein